MTKLQMMRHRMAQKGIECTPDEVRGLVGVARHLRELSKLSKDELLAIFDLKDRKQRAVYNAVLSFQKV